MDWKNLRYLRNTTVLIVEGDEDLLDLYGLVLRSVGADVVKARNAREALRALDEARPDVILSELRLPDVDGCELMRRIRARPPSAGGRLPGVALTTSSRERALSDVMAAGFQVLLCKPCSLDEMIGAIADLSETASAAAG